MSVFRRIMLGGGVDIDKLPDTCKLYYKATAKIKPKTNSLGAPLIANKWDSTTGEGIIVCSSDIIKIGDNAFYIYTSLTNVTIPNSVTEIGSGAFWECGLTSITIPNSVTKIGSHAFYYCSSLTSVTIPNSVTSIERYTFRDCPLLTSITIPNSITKIGESAFYNCKSLASITIPNSVTSIGSSAFYGCTSLTSVTIPDSVTSIGSHTFYGCTSLTSITISDSVTSIVDMIFYGCTSLTSITIPDSVTSIGSCAFYSCTSMQYYDFSTHESVPTLANTNAFYKIPSTCKIIVPDALYDEWIAATNWSKYASYIIKKSDWDASQTTE